MARLPPGYTTPAVMLLKKKIMSTLTPLEQKKLTTLRQNMEIVKNYYEYTENKESMANCGITYVHRLTPRAEIAADLPILSCNDVFVVVEMALSQIGYYTRDHVKQIVNQN
jgi:hypothetical protein